MKCQAAALLCWLALAAVAVAAPIYSVTDLGVLPAGIQSEAYGINASGQVVGRCVMPGGVYRAFVWDSVNGMQNVSGTSGTYSEAWGINDQGHIVGNMLVSSFNHAFVYNGNTTVDFGQLCVARAINNSDKVAGYDGIGGPWKWDSINGKQYIGQTGQYQGLSYGINSAGKITGESDTNINSVITQNAFLYDGTMQNLGSLGNGSRGFGINDNDWVVGRSNDNTFNLRAFYWHPTSGGMQDMGVGVNANANDVNNLNVAVGDAQFGAFRWTTSGYINLNSALDGSGAGWFLRAATAINDSDWIVGYGTHNGQQRGYLLKPVPEPQTLAGLCVALVVLGTSARRARYS